MIDRFASCAKSAVSVDEECQRDACLDLKRHYQQLFIDGSLSPDLLARIAQLKSELQQSQKRIANLESNKRLQTQEINYLKQQLSVKNNKLNQIESSRDETDKEFKLKECSDISIIIVREKQQQIASLVSTLRIKERQLTGLQFEVEQLKEQLSSTSALLNTIQDSSQAQILFYCNSLASLQGQLAVARQKIQESRRDHQRQLDSQLKKWEAAAQQSAQQEVLLTRQIQQIKYRETKNKQLINQLRLQKQDAEERLNDEQSKTAWLTQLLEEAKTDFMHSQLKKLQAKQKSTLRHKAAESKANRSTSTTLTSNKRAKYAWKTLDGSAQDSEAFEPEWPQIIELNAFNQN